MHLEHLEHQVRQTAQLLTTQQSQLALLPFWVILVPLLGAGLVLFFHRYQWLKNLVVMGSTTVVFGLLLLMYRPVVTGITLGGRFYRNISCVFPLIYPFQGSFKVDPAGLLLAAITAFLWITSCLHAISYMTIEGHRTRYEFFVLLSLTANLGVLLAGDLLTLFIFFEGMIIFPYSLIAHKEDAPSLEGANYYLYLGVFSSLCLLFAMFLLYSFVGSLQLEPMAELINARFPGGLRYVLAGLMIFGFGGKAGVFFEHFWLPKAHPVAPSPASALLSGAMIKAGAYGIFRTVNMLFIPKQAGLSMEWLTSQYLGYALIWLGVITMFLGVLNALISANAKKMLAYHSVSQMGYIVLGIGCAAYMGREGAMGLAGALYHIVNHALFKSALFLTVGAVYFRTHELDMYKLGGLWRKMPITCLAMLIAVCGISGIPGFNGFASKTLLHHAVWEAYEHSVHLSPTGQPDFWLRVAEIIFMITAGGTFASNIKLWILNFMGKPSEKSEHAAPVPWPMKLSLSIASMAIIILGLYPNWLLDKIIGPALEYFNYDPGSHAYHLLYNMHATSGVRSVIPLLYDPVSKAFMHSSEVIHNLSGSGDALLLGTAVCILGLKFGWFHVKVPEWLSTEFYYRRVFDGFIHFCRHPFSNTIRVIDDLVAILLVDAWQSPATVTRRAQPRDSELTKADKQGLYNWFGPMTVTRWVASLEHIYDRSVDGMIFAHSIVDLLEKVNRDSGPQPVSPLADVWDKTPRKEGRLIHKIKALCEKTPFFQNIRIMWSSIIRSNTIVAFWRKQSRFDLEVYNPFIDRVLFGVSATEAPEQKDTAFNRLCRYLSNIHTGDISTYISWIIIFLAIITATLVGNLYIKSTLHIIVLITVLIVLTFLGVVLFQERDE